MENNTTGSLDTNILLRLVVGDVPPHTKLITQLFEKVSVLHVADIVIFEMVFVLSSYYQFSKEDIIESVYTIIRHEKISCNRKLFELGLQTYIEHAKLSFVDSTLPHYANLTNSKPLYTFDVAIAKACTPMVTALI
jgi:predicted nucleic-acid-binding protein